MIRTLQRAGLAAGLLLVCVAPADATFAGSNGPIAAQVTGGLSAVDPVSGTTTSLGSLGVDPAYSDDARIATAKLVGGYYRSLVVANADGSSPATVLQVTTGTVRNPSWSPNGAKLAFARADATRRIQILDLATSTVTAITSGSAGGQTHPSWSADGARIAYTQQTNAGTLEVWVAAADGSASVKVADGFAPSWSPDSQSLTYVGGPKRDVFTLALDGSVPVQITNWPGGSGAPFAIEPVFSPDGDQVAYVRAQASGWSINYRLERVPAGGGPATVLTTLGFGYFSGGTLSWRAL